MIISFTGCDGVGKTTHVEQLKKRISERYGLSCIDLLSVTGGSLVYESVDDIDLIYKELEKYDLIVTRFYMRSIKCDEEQRKLRFETDSIFSASDRVRSVLGLVKTDSEIWQNRVIKKLHKNNKIIIADRYYYDEIAYRSLYDIQFSEIERFFINSIKPDLAFALTANIDVIKDRNSDREDVSTALFRKDERLQALLDRIDDVADRYGLVKIQSGGKDIWQVSDMIFDKFKECYSRP